MTKLTIVGTGYVGLVAGTCLAEMGNHVTCVDVDSSKVDRLRSGELTIFEPGLKLFFDRNRSRNRLHFTTELEGAVATSDVIFLALPTPPGEDGSADLSYVLGVARQLGPLLDSYKVIVTKSTVPVGTADLVREAIESNCDAEAGKDFDVVSNPEFLREGVAVDDFMKPERIVIGSSSVRAQDIMRKLYEPFVRNGNPIFVMDERTAEMSKYAANSFLATKISFMNEIANLCEKVGANVDNIRRVMGSDHRIGSPFLYPGVGYGGSCFPKDVQALVETGTKHGSRLRILESVVGVNIDQRKILFNKVQDHFDGNLEGRKFAIWGLAFKPNTDDIREAPAHVTIEHLLEAGASVSAFDPEAMDTTKAVFGDKIEYAEDSYSTLMDADALLICTEWHEFRHPEFQQIKMLLKNPLVFDGRNVFDPASMTEEGFDYYSIGRSSKEIVGSLSKS